MYCTDSRLSTKNLKAECRIIKLFKTVIRPDLNIGHEKSRLEARPCLIVSTDEINKKSSNVIVVPLSKEIKYKKGSTTELAYPWHYVLQKSKYNQIEIK